MFASGRNPIERIKQEEKRTSNLTGRLFSSSSLYPALLVPQGKRESLLHLHGNTGVYIPTFPAPASIVDQVIIRTLCTFVRARTCGGERDNNRISRVRLLMPRSIITSTKRSIPITHPVISRHYVITVTTGNATYNVDSTSLR